MKNTLETRLGVFFALCFVVAVIIIEMVGVAEYFKPGYQIHANFKTVQELKKGDAVKMAGVTVGRVSGIQLSTNDLVRVSMKIKKAEAPIKTDSKATIKFTGLMGQNFVSIEFGSEKAPRASDGFTLVTTEHSDLNSLMAKLEGVANEVQIMRKDLSSENLASLMGPLNNFIEVNSTNLSEIVGNVRKVSEQISGGKGTVGKLINDDTLYSSAMTAVAGIQAGVVDLKAVAADARSMISDINAGKGTLGLLVRDDALYRETTNAMTNVREIVQKVNHGQGTVGQLINDESFLKNAKVSLQKLDKATEGLEDQGPLSVLGIAIGTLF
jgi:phospholipid/cholesterol/gamma-HCH transport system substrate-binding protein